MGIPISSQDSVVTYGMPRATDQSNNTDHRAKLNEIQFSSNHLKHHFIVYKSKKRPKKTAAHKLQWEVQHKTSMEKVLYVTMWLHLTAISSPFCLRRNEGIWVMKWLSLYQADSNNNKMLYSAQQITVTCLTLSSIHGYFHSCSCVWGGSTV